MRSSIPALVVCLVLPCGLFREAAAQSFNVTTAGDLSNAIQAANTWTGSGPFTINFQISGTLQPTAQMVIGLTAANTSGLVINGNNATIDMSQANGGAGDRAFFVANGTVAFNNLTIANGRAVGGNGGGGAGGGAGLGAGLFVANSASIPGVPALPTNVTLSGVQFTGNTATGGAGGVNTAESGVPTYQTHFEGGGGMGGNGGHGYIAGIDSSGGGGGGFGFGANGGNASSYGDPGTSGAMTIAGAGGGGGGGYNGAAGGPNGGGGGGGNDGLFQRGAGGGGGVGGFAANGSSGGSGGFGGGGGGTGGDPVGGSIQAPGAGGFGGGGGGSINGLGTGGFGGGGGGADGNGAVAAGGFGGGISAQNFESVLGGGGAGLGGAVFVMSGASLTITGSSAFTANAVVSGSGAATPSLSAANGSAYGADLFLGGNVVFNTTGTTVVNSLGGAGNLLDSNVANNASDPNANGGVIVAGSGMLLLTGTSYYSGITTVNSGVLALAPNATEQGTTVVTVGQNPGDVATLGLASSSSLFLGGFNVTTPSASTDQPVMIAQTAGSTGTVVIGNGAGSNGAYVGARVFTGGAGNASVVFTQQYWAAGTNPVYPFLTSLTGSLGIVQNGLGTTSLQPLYGPNTFSGPVTVNSGTLETTGTAAALAGATSITVNTGGVFAPGQSDGVNDAAVIVLAGGVLAPTTSLSDSVAVLITTSPSWIDLGGGATTLSFSFLSISSPLAIWNYSAADDLLTVSMGVAPGSLEQITFYGDSGSTLLGYGGFEGTRLVPVPVPEPSTYAMALAGLACGGFSMWRRRKRA